MCLCVILTRVIILSEFLELIWFDLCRLISGVRLKFEKLLAKETDEDGQLW